LKERGMVEESESMGSIGAVGAAEPAPVEDSSFSTPASVAQPPTAQDIQDAVQQVNDRWSSVNRVLELNVDAGSGLTVATIRDSQTGEVLQQYPGTDSLQIARMLADWSSGKLVLLDLIA
jgi:uncharacterized FlaG/YvyC family protein